jgi:predicted acyl esterase
MPGMVRRAHVSVCALSVALVLVCGGGVAQAFDAHGSARQVYVTGLAPHARMALLAPSGHRVARKRADAQGGLLFRGIRPAAGYHVRLSSSGATSPALTVMSDRSAPPSTSVYDQSIPSSGYGYLTTRDGTKLAIDVHPPQDVSQALPGGIQLPKPPINLPGPAAANPTLIEYSGYGYADPAGPQNGIAAIANIMGFTVVDVNMRGTGCSGGAYDFFEPLQNLDGYDVIETIARQPWVLHHKVGMMGISYGAISQLFTAKTQPPSLAAIAPLSVIDNTQTTLYPGGVLNTGFAVAWAKERIHDAKPASATGGQSYAYKRVQEGDATCRANQAMHGEAMNLLKKIRANDHYVPKVANPLSPITFVNRIKVPVFMACQFTDEQTGGHCPDLAEHFTGTSRKWFTFTNGTHVDSLDPATANRFYDFLELYVAQQAPILHAAAIHAAAPALYQAAMGIPGVTLPNDPIQEQPTYAGALAAFEQLPQIRVLFDNGAGGPQPGYPNPGFEQSFARFPIPGTRARTWYFAARGAMKARKPSRAKVDAFHWNAHALTPTDFSGDTAAGTNGLWTATPPYHWNQSPKGTALSYLTAPLAANTAVIGAGAVHAWIRSPKRNVDLQVTISEVRPDGKETFVQDGWLRGNERKLDTRKSTRLEPVLSLRKSAVRALPRNRFVKVTIPLYYEGHAYRKGSRIRVVIAAPNGTQPIWAFAQTQPKKRHPLIRLAHSHKRPSNLMLPVVGGVSVPTGLPPCPGLRGEPCRSFRPIANRRG